VLKRIDPLPGQDVLLTIDVRLQEAAEAALGGRRGAIVAIQPSTGEVLAMVSQPSFDPNPFVTGISFKAYAELRDSIDQPLFNRVLRGLYPPGSTIKPMMAVAALDAGVITPTSRVFDPGFGIYATTAPNVPELKGFIGYAIVIGVMASICLGLYFRFRKLNWL
jgi:penicillin-binding protein 2